MSYSIYNKAMFLKIGNDKYLPMFEAAESNVYDENNKRAKNWSNTIFSNKSILLSENEVVALPNEIRQKLINEKSDKYNDSCFGYFYGLSIRNKRPINTSFNDFKNLFKNGMAYAITFNELKNLGIYLYAYRYNKEKDYATEQVVISNENDIITLSENKDVVWFEYLNLSENKYNIIKAIKDIKKGKNKNFIVKTNLGYISRFNEFKPCYALTINEALKVSNTISKWIVKGLFSISSNKKIYSVECRGIE